MPMDEEVNYGKEARDLFSAIEVFIEQLIIMKLDERRVDTTNENLDSQ